MKSSLKQVVPSSLRPVLRRFYHFYLDTLDIVRGRRDSLTAPRHISCIGAGDSRKIREEFLKYFIEFGGLKPEHQVLDVGCGTGRMAAALLRYLHSSGSYDGFDIVKSGIDWCQKKITVLRPQFQFKHADIINKAYNPLGTYQASRYKFPYSDASKDFVFLTSVFTHMLPLEVANYLSEIARVMKKGATGVITFFLINAESRRLLVAGKTHQNFLYDHRGFWTTDPETPETAIAYDEFRVRQLFENSGLEIIDPTHYGSWSGRKDFLSYQDLLIARKK